MDVTTCGLSPLVFGELYQMLAESSSYSDLLEERLAKIELDTDWLADAAERYAEDWSVTSANADAADDTRVLASDHAALASWILAVLAVREPSFAFGNQLRERVSTKVIARFPDIVRFPSFVKPVVNAWTLGIVIGQVDHELPVVPAVFPSDENVAAAYRGLVEHVMHLSSVATPWPEMLGTSTLWRGTGLAEGMIPEAVSAPDAIKNLILVLNRFLPTGVMRGIAAEFSLLAERRNVLSHVGKLAGLPTFVEVHELADDWTKVRPVVMGLTQYLCNQVTTELAGGSASIVRPGLWDTIQWDLSASQA